MDHQRAVSTASAPTTSRLFSSRPTSRSTCSG